LAQNVAFVDRSRRLLGNFTLVWDSSMQTNRRSMQIITRRASERILIDQQVTVTVVEVLEGEVTLEIAGPDGDVQQVTLCCDVSATALSAPVDLELASC
jgi:hypothetical protein